jgi:hypothetical protein
MYSADQKDAIKYCFSRSSEIDWGGTSLIPGDPEAITVKFARWSALTFSPLAEQEMQLKAMKDKAVLDILQGTGYFQGALP